MRGDGRPGAQTEQPHSHHQKDEGKDLFGGRFQGQLKQDSPQAIEAVVERHAKKEYIGDGEEQLAIPKQAVSLGNGFATVRGKPLSDTPRVHDEHVEAEQEEDYHSCRHVPGPVFRFAHRSSYLANPRNS